MLELFRPLWSLFWFAMMLIALALLFVFSSETDDQRARSTAETLPWVGIIFMLLAMSHPPDFIG